MTSRLDALKARLAIVLAEDKDGVAVSPECPYSDAELGLLDHAREDIARLVAVVDGYIQDKAGPGFPRTEDALAYWLEEAER